MAIKKNSREDNYNEGYRPPWCACGRGAGDIYCYNDPDVRTWYFVCRECDPRLPPDV